jgi:hypothetical protein
MPRHLSAGLGERQVAKLVEHDEAEPPQVWHGIGSIRPNLDPRSLIAWVTAVRSISEQIQLVSYLQSSAFGGVVGKRLI